MPGSAALLSAVCFWQHDTRRISLIPGAHPNDRRWDEDLIANPSDHPVQSICSLNNGLCFSLVTIPCRSGGIGRRAWFRSMYPQGCGGSSPFFGTRFDSVVFNSFHTVQTFCTVLYTKFLLRWRHGCLYLRQTKKPGIGKRCVPRRFLRLPRQSPFPSKNRLPCCHIS